MSFTEKISVTGAHIARGEECAPESCPIALAIADAHPNAMLAEVFNDFAALTQDYTVILTANLPKAARDFVEGFDTHGLVGPIELELTWQTENELSEEVSGP